ncbi:MAG: glycosyltransferase [Candidatus Micrarchaeaceae archaeon]
MLYYYITIISLAMASLSFLYYSVTSYFAMNYNDAPKLKRASNPGDITIIVPVYKEGKDMFERCVESVRRQRARFLVVGDSSDEPYRSIAIRNGGRFLLLKKHSGKRKALSAAIRKTKTKYVLFVDSDTILPDNAVKSMLSKAEENIGGIGALSSINHKGNKISYCTEFFFRINEVVNRAMSSGGSVFVIPGRCSMYQTKIIKPYLLSRQFLENRVIGTIGFVSEDADITGYVSSAGYRTIIDCDVKVVTEPQDDFKLMVKQMSRWVRDGYMLFAKELIDGSYSRKGAYYSFSMFYLFLAPIIVAFIGLSRLAIMLNTSAFNLANILPFIANRITYASVIGIALAIAGSVIFLAVTSRSIPKKKIKTIAFGGLTMLIMFAASIYTLATIWKQGSWLTR